MNAKCASNGQVMNRLLAGFAWAELFLWMGLHWAWIFGKSTPLSVESTSGVLVAAAPFGALLVAAILASFKRPRAALLAIESRLHLKASVLLTILVAYVVLRDPFNPGVPLSWPFCLWSIAMSFALLGSLACTIRMRDQIDLAPALPWMAFIVAIWWMGMLFVATTMAFPMHFWSFAILFHAAMAYLSRREAGTPSAEARPPRAVWPLITNSIEGLMWVAVLFVAQLRILFSCTLIGSYEGKWIEFYAPYTHPFFVLALAIFIVANRIGRPVRFATSVLALALAIYPEQASPMAISLVLGYTIAGLFYTTRRQGAVVCVICAMLACGAGVLGVMGFSLSGMIVHLGESKGVAEFLLRQGRWAAGILFALWLLPEVIGWRRSARVSSGTYGVVEPASPRAQMCLFVALACAAVLPSAILIPLRFWPPILTGRGQAPIAIEEPAGLCHAGYSRSDEEYALLDKLGVKMMRVDFRWNGIQPAPDRWDFSEKDAYIEAAEKRGARVLALLDFDNNAVEASPAGKAKDCYIAPEDVPLFLEYVKRVVERYRGRVYAFEIWNEPDIARFWQGTPEEFYALAQRTAEAVKAVDTSIRLLGTAMTGPLGSWSAAQIEGLHKAGALAKVDHPTGHVYLSNPRSYYNEFMKLIVTARKHGHTGSVWITEIGDPDGGVYPWRASSAELAEHAIKTNVIATSLGIEKLVWYCLSDSSAEDQAKHALDSECFFGLIGPGGQWKPAAYAYQLFNQNCRQSALRPDLVAVSGGVAARQMRTALYRRENGESALVLWNEPMLRPGARARVHLDLGQTDGAPIVHDITSTYTKALFDDVIEVSETPTFITYKAKDANQPLALRVISSPADGLWLAALAVAVLAAAASVGGRITRGSC